MLVKAKWNVKDSSGWHSAGEVFNTNDNLGDAVEALEKPKKQEPAKAPVKEPETAPETVEAEPEKETPKPRNTARRRSGK